MKRKSQGKSGEAALKIDMPKAYGRVEWAFLKEMMLQMGFHSKWVDMIMLCITTVKYSVIHNGCEIGPIVPQRGLRQGDPLSPYLFLICAEGITSILQSEILRGKNKSQVFAFIKDKAYRRMIGWRNILLSQAEIRDRRGRGIRWKNWSKLSRREINGALGFIKLHEFNIALLARQSWKLVCEPNALASRNFQARYYSQSNFMEAKIASNPNYVWRSLMSSQELICKKDDAIHGSLAGNFNPMIAEALSI